MVIMGYPCESRDESLRSFPRSLWTAVCEPRSFGVATSSTVARIMVLMFCHLSVLNLLRMENRHPCRKTRYESEWKPTTTSSGVVPSIVDAVKKRAPAARPITLPINRTLHGFVLLT